MVILVSTQFEMIGQNIQPKDLEGNWKFESWKTLYANFHPDMEPTERSDSWKEVGIGIEYPTSVTMEAVFKSRNNFTKSNLTLVNKAKSGPWLEANFMINSQIKEAWWEYDPDENIIGFTIEGYEYNLYFYIKELSSNKMIFVEKFYKTESDVYFNYITMIKD